MRGRAMAEIQSGNRTLAPFDGITRIRFKGSVAGATLSAIAAPPQYCFSFRIGLAQAKSINCSGPYRLQATPATAEISKGCS